MFRRLEISPNQREHPVGVLRAGRPNFLTIDNEVVAIDDRFGLQCCQIRPRARLAVALAPIDLTANDFWQMSLFLFLGAKLEKRGANHAESHSCAWG